MLRNSPARRRLRAIRRRLSSVDEIWRRALPHELAFWAKYIDSQGLEHPDEFRRRMDADAPIDDPLLLDAIDLIGASSIRIIDVGAGPMSLVGTHDPRDPNRSVDLVAIDPLADEYNELLKNAGISPPVVTQACRGEDVASMFGEGSFDIAYARNSLDHSADPMTAIKSIVTAVRAGGVLVMIHGRREAEARGYEELHQWNFDVRDGRFVLFRTGAFFDIEQELGGLVSVSSDVFDTGHGVFVSATLVRSR